MYNAADEITEAIYKSKKFILGMVNDNWERLKPAQRKYYEDIKLFVEGYEANVIKSWWKFFKR